MANHKKKRHPAARAHCSMCKPWKDGGVARESEAFEGHSAHVSRVTAETEEVAVSEWPHKKPQVSNIKKRTGKNKPKCKHVYGPWGYVDQHHMYGSYLKRVCYGCGREEQYYGFMDLDKSHPPKGAGKCLEHDYIKEDLQGRSRQCMVCKVCKDRVWLDKEPEHD